MPRHYLSRAEIVAIVKEAHDECRAKVPISSHRTPAGRSRLGRDISEYRGCLRDTIRRKVIERLKAKGLNVKG